MSKLLTLLPGFAFSYSGRENYIIQVPEVASPITIEYGKIYGIQGPNGSGKTTLLNIINGYLRPTQGCITYFNNKPYSISNTTYKENVTILKVANFMTGVRRLFQIPILPDDLTILDSVLLAKRNKQNESFWNSFNPKSLYSILMNKKKEPEIEKAIALLKDFNFTEPNKSNSTLSYGERRIITVLQMLFSEATLLLMDEPFANIHIDNVKKIKNYLKQYINGFNRSIIIIEHNNNNIRDFVDITLTISERNIITKENRC